MANLPSGTVTFLFTDIDGSTALWEHDRVVMASAGDWYFALLDAAIQAYGGIRFRAVGDAVQAAFPAVHVTYEQKRPFACAVGGGPSSAGLAANNPAGWRRKPAYETGITGQSSGRGAWWLPTVYQSTTSVSSMGRSAAPVPRSARLWRGFDQRTASGPLTAWVTGCSLPQRWPES